MGSETRVEWNSRKIFYSSLITCSSTNKITHCRLFSMQIVSPRSSVGVQKYCLGERRFMMPSSVSSPTPWKSGPSTTLMRARPLRGWVPDRLKMQTCRLSNMLPSPACSKNECSTNLSQHGVLSAGMPLDALVLRLVFFLKKLHMEYY